MGSKKNRDDGVASQRLTAAQLNTLNESSSVDGIPEPGRWLVAEYQPTALFSLKTSLATSSVGKSLVLPTPYSIKMAFVDAAFRAGLSNAESAHFLKSLVSVEVRVAPPEVSCVTHTFVKVRQESRNSDPLRPYISSIAYREVVHHSGIWRWAFDLAAGDPTIAPRLVAIAPHINYIGKRGSFIQFIGLSRRESLSHQFTQTIQNQEAWNLTAGPILPLDDFGPEADMEILSSFTEKSPKRDKHRRFIKTIVPIRLVNTGPGFSEYRSTGSV
jgi:hypothetical protein